MIIKNLILTMILSLGLMISSSSSAKNTQIQNAINIMNDISNLAVEFNLTPGQKTEIKVVLFDYLPQMAMKATAMLNNRQELLQNSIGNDDVNEGFLAEIAEKQAQLLKNLIIEKEHMKKELRMILTGEQKGFVDAILDAIIQRRINHS